MTHAIVTRYRAPTAKRGARISAKPTSGTKGFYFYYDHELDADANHTLAAKRLAVSRGWAGDWQGAALDLKGAMVWVCTNDKFSHKQRFDVQSGGK